MSDKMVSLEYYLEKGEIWVELWEGKVHSARLLDEFITTPRGKTLIDNDIQAYLKAGRCRCDKDPEKDFNSLLDWFQCVIRNNFAKHDGVADSSHRGSFVTHIPESRCPLSRD